MYAFVFTASFEGRQFKGAVMIYYQFIIYYQIIRLYLLSCDFDIIWRLIKQYRCWFVLFTILLFLYAVKLSIMNSNQGSIILNNLSIPV